MRFDVLTLFPEMFEGVFGTSILKRAQDAGLLELVVTDIRDYAHDKHRSVDDKPYGGGAGMVMMCGPVFEAAEAVLSDGPAADAVVLLTPQGKRLTQAIAGELARCRRVMLIAGHYEGFDERIREHLATREISIGDYVLSGGELPAMVLVDAVARLLPGVLGGEASVDEESFSDGLLEYPQYTRPAEYRGWKVPDILISGHHGMIDRWRREQSEERTRQKRPDLYEDYKRRS